MMSADNGVYILRTIRNTKKEYTGCFIKTDPYYVYRVAYASAIDNFEWYEENQLYNLGYYMNRIWGKSIVYENEEEAKKAAVALSKKFTYLEYGISNLYTEYFFPGD